MHVGYRKTLFPFLLAVRHITDPLTSRLERRFQNTINSPASKNPPSCISLRYGTKKCLLKVWCLRAICCGAERGENGRDYVQLKPTLCLRAGVTKSGQECSPRLVLSLRTKSAASLYCVRWIINVTANIICDCPLKGKEVCNQILLCWGTSGLKKKKRNQQDSGFQVKL